jgi:hypothetical protein
MEELLPIALVAFLMASALGAFLPDESRLGKACRRWAADIRGVARDSFQRGQREAEPPKDV